MMNFRYIKSNYYLNLLLISKKWNKSLNSKNKLTSLIIIFYFLFSNISYSYSKDLIYINSKTQKSIQKSKIELKDIKQIIIKNNNELLTLLKLIDSSSFNLKSKIAKRYPNINLEANGIPQYLNGQTYNNKKTNTKSSQISVNPSIKIRWDLIDPQRGPEIKAAKDSLNISRNNYEIKKRDLIKEARSRYHFYQRSFEEIISARNILNSSLLSLNQSKARMKAGVGSKLDVLEATAQLARDDQFLEEKKEDFLNYEVSLKEILNLNKDFEIEKKHRLIGYWNHTLKSSLKNGLEKSFTLKNIKFQKSLKVNESNILLNDNKPFIYISNTFSSSFAKGSELSPTIDLDEKESSYSNIIGLNLSWNIFDGGESKNSAKSKFAESEAEEFKSTNLTNILKKDIVDSYSKLRLSKKRLLSSKKEFDATKESLNLSRLRYESGITNLRELINIQKDLAKSRENKISAVTNYNLTLDNLERLTGLKMSDNCFENNALLNKEYLNTICNF